MVHMPKANYLSSRMNSFLSLTLLQAEFSLQLTLLEAEFSAQLTLLPTEYSL